MTHLLSLFANNVLPIMLAAGAGYLVSKYAGIEPRSISQIAFKIFIPCLLFELLTTSQLANQDIFRMGGFAVVSVLALGGVTWVLARILHYDNKMISALLLVVMFGNAGNYGLSLNLFAFGEQALAYASVYFAISIILINTVGLVIASLGNANLKKALVDLLKTPAVYALVLAIVFNVAGWQLPGPLQRTVSILADGSIPLMIVLMGIQLYHVQGDRHIFTLLGATFMRLVAAPVIVLPIALAFGLQGASFQAAIAESAMPTAVMMTMVATEYNAQPAFVTMAVALTTLLSPLTITPLLALLGA